VGEDSKEPFKLAGIKGGSKVMLCVDLSQIRLSIIGLQESLQEKERGGTHKGCEQGQELHVRGNSAEIGVSGRQNIRNGSFRNRTRIS